MVMRAIQTQLCRVCGWRTYNKAEMADHIEDKHGRDVERQAPTFTTRAKDQMELNASQRVSQRTPWGQEFR